MKIAFSPERKSQVIALNKGSYIKVIVKGAPEKLLKMCDRFMDLEGNIKPLDESMKNHIYQSEIVERMCKEGLKSVVYGFKEYQMEEWNYLKQ